MTTVPPSRLTDAQLVELLALLQDVDSVELKLTVPESDQRSTVQGLGMDPLDAQIRQVFFFDTPDLRLDSAGVVVRARRVQGRADDTVVKLRPVVPADLPQDIRRSGAFTVEVDAMPGGFVCSGTLKGRLGRDDVRQAVAGAQSVRKLFNKEQRQFFTAHAPEGLTLDDLSILGPLTVLKLKFSPADFDREMVAEMWLFPDYSRVLELSTRCTPGEAFDVAARARAFLASHGVPLDGEQQAKTRAALNYFGARLREGTAGSPG